MIYFHRRCLSMSLLALTACFSTRLLAAQPVPTESAKLKSVLDMSEFIRDWQVSKGFTIAVAEAMPADLYGFKPNPDEMTFGEQMIHIAQSNVYRFKQISSIETSFPLDLSKPPASDKDDVIKLLGQSFDYVLDVLPQITADQLQRTWHIPSWKNRPDPDGRAMIMNMFVHTAHHRAQCEVYLRAKGIKPPDYEF